MNSQLNLLCSLSLAGGRQAFHYLKRKEASTAEHTERLPLEMRFSGGLPDDACKNGDVLG